MFYRKGSTSIQDGKIETSTSLKSLKVLYMNNYNKFKDLSFKNISIPNSRNKHKLNYIQFPLKRTKPNITYKNQVLNLINIS